MTLVNLSPSLPMTEADWRIVMERSAFSHMIHEIKQLLQHIIDGTEPPLKFDYDSLYISPEAMEDIRQWPTK